jgi:hypothetical protein
MFRTVLAMFTFVSLTACAVDTPSDGGGTGGGGTGGGGGNGTGGGSGTGGGGGGALTVPSYLTALGMKDCDDAFACKATFPTDGGATFDQVFGASASACYADAAMYFNAAAVQASIAAGRITFDGAAAATCIAGIPAPVCATYWTQGSDYPAACDTALVGKIADGGTCTIDFDCTSLASICDDTTKKCAPAPAEARTASGVATARTMLRFVP